MNLTLEKTGTKINIFGYDEYKTLIKKELDDLSSDYENSVTKRILLDTLEQLHIRQLSLV